MGRELWVPSPRGELALGEAPAAAEEEKGSTRRERLCRLGLSLGWENKAGREG